jgi:Trk K+ transport system NAD-binding subunit
MSYYGWRASPFFRNLRRSWRRLRASWRDTLLLLREFRQPLFLFVLAVALSGWLYDLLSGYAGEPVSSLVEAIYITLSLTFFQSGNGPFPTQWYLQIFYFLMPVIGIGLLALGLTDFGILLFNRRARGKEWEMAVASTFSNHAVLVGLGHLGYRVVKELYELDQDVVAISLSPNLDTVHKVRELGVPVIEDDGTREAVLIAAGVPQAQTILLCTQDDSLNLRMALKARNLNPKIEVVIRIFDDDFAASLESQFGFHAMSATGMAAPIFAAIAAHVDVTPPITIEGQPHILANLLIPPKSHLGGMTVQRVEEDFQISVVLLCRNGERLFHPAGQELIQAGQTVAIFGEPDHINHLIHENRI